MTKQVEGQMSLFAQDIWFGKMSKEHYPRREKTEKEKTSKPFWKKSSGSQNPKLPICLCLKTDGHNQDLSTMTWEDGALLGEYTMRSFGQSPKIVKDCALSQILTERVPEKYYLSEKACQGIINRSERRGKPLPEVLKEALMNQIRGNDL